MESRHATIYGVYRSRASRNIWLANELGIPFKHVPVMQLYRLPDPEAAKGVLHTKSPEFLKVNPNGHVPRSTTTAWCCTSRSPSTSTSPGSTAARWRRPTWPRMAQMAMWALWAATEVEPHALNMLYHRVAKPPAERDPKVAQAAVEALRAPFAVLDKALAAGGHSSAAASPWPTSTSPRSCATPRPRPSCSRPRRT